LIRADTAPAVIEEAVSAPREQGAAVDGRCGPDNAADPQLVPVEGSWTRTVQALVHSPFQPIAYLLVDENLLMPARWLHESRPPPGVGERVSVQVPYGAPQPELLPLSAFPAEFDQVGGI